MIYELYNYLKKIFVYDIDYEIQIEFSLIDFKKNDIINNEINKIIKKIYDDYINKSFVQKTLFPLKYYPYSSYSFYFFDKFIENRDLSAGSLKDIFDKNILNMCNIDLNNLNDISLESHAMCFYNFKYNNNNYLIFSNSGLGSDNCNLDANEFINNKLYYYDKDFDIVTFINFINKLSLNITSLTFRNKIIREKIDKLDFVYPRNINKYDVINELKLLPKIGDKINFLYYILDYYSRKNIDKIYPCNFEHVLNGSSDDYTNYIIDCNKNYKDLNSFIQNYKKPDYVNYVNFTKEPSENLKKFISYVTKLNTIIENINLPSFHYNFTNKTIHINKSGLIYNYQQKSGSCNFYCIFNILILMIFLKNFENNNPNNAIISLLILNYIILLLVCLPYDKKFYEDPSIRGTHPYNNNQIVFVQKIYDDLEFINEINNFYPSNETLFNFDMPIDYYYNISINKYVKRENTTSTIFYINTTSLLDLSKQIYFIIHNIRKQILKIIDSSIKNIIYDYFDKVYDYYTLLYTNDTFKKKIRDFCNGYKDIYIIYLCWLIKIYNEPGFIFVESSFDQKKNFRYGLPVDFNILVPVYFNIDIIFLTKTQNKDLTKLFIKIYGSIDRFKFRLHEHYEIPELLYNDILLYFNYDELSSFSNEYLKDYYQGVESTNIFSNQKYKFIYKYLNLGFLRDLNYLNRIHFTRYNKQQNKNNFILNVDNIITKKTIVPGRDDYYNIFEQYIYFYNVYQYSDDAYKILNENYLISLKKKLIELTIQLINQQNNFNHDMLILYIFVLTDFKLLCLHYEEKEHFYFNYVNLINIETKFLLYKNSNILIKIKEIISKKSSNFYVDIIKLFGDFIINYESINDTLKIKKFKLIENNYLKTLFKKDDMIYELIYSKSLYTFKDCEPNELINKNLLGIEFVSNEETNYRLLSALNRFGINILDNYLILIPTIYNVVTLSYNIHINVNYPIYIFIKDDIYIEINFINENQNIMLLNDIQSLIYPNRKIDYNNCILYKNNKPYKLILNADLKLVPFLKLLPPMSPYLLYKKDNEYNIDIILSKNNMVNPKCLLFNKASNINYNDNKFIYLTFIVSDSLFMPINNRFDINNYNNLLNYYKIANNPLYSLKFDKEYMIQKFKYIEDITFEKNIIMIKNFFLQLSKNISIDNDLNSELSNLFNKNNPNCEIDFIKIMKQNRLCTYYSMNYDCLIQKEKLISYLNIYINQLSNKIYNKYKSSSEIIIENMNEILKIRICNYVINILSFINEDSKCWEIQQNFSYFDNTLFLLNNLKKKKFFYKYEIIYLLSNSFIFNEEQFDKYRNILDNIDNPNLNLHHFLMGKGKSSFLTPMLSMGLLLLKNKYVSIITAEHLINDMREYVSYYEYILSKTIKIITASEAKSNFLQNTNLMNNHDMGAFIKASNPDMDAFIKFVHDKMIFDPIIFKDDMSEEEVAVAEKRTVEKSQYKIITDINSIKVAFINETYKETVNIIDEFDLHYNYISSMYNIVSESNIITYELFKYICLYLYYKYEHGIDLFLINIHEEILFLSDVFPIDDLVLLKESYISSNFDEDIKIQIITFEKTSDELNKNRLILHKLIDKTCEQLKIKKYNLDYGFDDVDKKANNLCIPYIRKNTPMSGSKFSDLLLTIIFTFHFYKNNGYKLRTEDYKYLDNNPFLYNKIFNISIEHKENIEKINDKYKLIKMLINYLYNTNANDNLKYSIEQYNCSFQDIIYNKFNQAQIGYTGTAFIKLRNNYQYPEDHYAFRNIIIDNDMYMELYLALSCYGKTNKMNYKKILDKTKLNRFNVKRSSGHIENNWKISDSYQYDVEMVDCENDDFTKTIHIDDIIKYNPSIFSISCQNDEIIKIIKEYEPFKIQSTLKKISDGWKLSDKQYKDDNYINCYKKEEEKIVTIDEIIEINPKIKNKIYNLISNEKNEDYICNDSYTIESIEDSKREEIDSENNRAQNIIKYIFNEDPTINRGIVDICGIFSDIKNIDITKIILTIKQKNKIVYFDNDHNAFEISNENTIPIRYNNKPTDLHFFYYDQTHCVGKDLKTPQVGNVSIIIDNKTRLTEFLQGIFRFRNLNKGTYLSFFICTQTFDTSSNKFKTFIQKISGNTIYNIINENEKNFQQNQEIGLNLQFFKTLIRYKNSQYKENPFKPLFIENIEKHPNFEKVYLDKLISDLSESDINRDLYNYFLHQDNINEFKNIILNTNSIETFVEISNEVQNQKQIENQRQNTIDISRIKLIEDIQLDFLLIHNNCSICTYFIGKPLFNEGYFKIDDKNIYISNNLIIETRKYNNYDLCFVVMDNLILIEKYSVCQYYYYNKFPCYEFKTCNLLNIGITKYKYLNFSKNMNSQIFINLFGINVINIFDKNIELSNYRIFCDKFNSIAINFLYIYYLKYLNENNLYIFESILYQYKNDDDTINKSINECYLAYINLKLHISAKTFDLDQQIIRTDNLENINDEYAKYEGKPRISEPYKDNTKKYDNIVTYHNIMRYDQNYKYQNYF
jgi:hypothetical protein